MRHACTTIRSAPARRLPAACALAAVLALPLAAGPAAAREGEAGGTLSSAASAAQRDLEQAQAELAALRARVEQEKLPLNKRLRELESRLIDRRRAFEETGRALDGRNLELANLGQEIQRLSQQRGYLSNLLDEYIRNLEARVHVTELQRWGNELTCARTAPEDESLSPAEAFGVQLGLVGQSIDRLDELMGGARFPGRVVGEGGRVSDVTFALVGPVALYGTGEPGEAGLAEQQLGSLEPNAVRFDDQEMVAAAGQVVETGSGRLPFDPTLGNAQKVEATQETILEHVAKGGPVMVPILLLAAASLAVSLMKWFQLARVRTPPQRRVQAMLESVRQHDHAAAETDAKGLDGPTGEMLRAGLERIVEPKELIEEVMFEKMLETRFRLQSFLSFIAVSAAAAPLLGLLGTVTGIINTFKLITIFGTGDAKTLSSGISEALITTEFGLIVAIPSLLLHAYLSRKARRLVDGMEKTAVSFLNRITPGEAAARLAEASGPSGEPERRVARPPAPSREPVPVMARPAPTDH